MKKGKITLIKMIRIFHAEIDIFVNISTEMYIKRFEEKVPGKVGECIFES